MADIPVSPRRSRRIAGLEPLDVIESSTVTSTTPRPNLRKKRELSTPEKQRIVTEVAQQIGKSGSAKLPAATWRQINTRFGVGVNYAQTLWKRNQEGKRLASQKAGKGGRKPLITPAVARRIRDELELLDYDCTYEQLAEVTGISRSVLARWGKKNLKLVGRRLSR